MRPPFSTPFANGLGRTRPFTVPRGVAAPANNRYFAAAVM